LIQQLTGRLTPIRMRTKQGLRDVHQKSAEMITTSSPDDVCDQIMRDCGQRPS
jgi:hypothetical protein